MISKITDAYYLQHEFSVDNRDDLSITSTLEGFDTQPYTKIQRDLILFGEQVTVEYLLFYEENNNGIKQ